MPTSPLGRSRAVAQVLEGTSQNGQRRGRGRRRTRPDPRVPNQVGTVLMAAIVYLHSRSFREAVFSVPSVRATERVDDAQDPGSHPDRPEDCHHDEEAVWEAHLRVVDP
jgi:hypothetical protein